MSTPVAQPVLRLRVECGLFVGRKGNTVAGHPRVSTVQNVAENDRPLTEAETAARQQQLIRALQEFEQAGVQLRHDLRTLDTMLRRTRRHYERGGHTGELARVGDVPGVRAGVTAAIAQFEQTRREARVATVRLAIAEGRSIGAVARMFGLSRQRLSRLMQQAAKDEPDA